jgi:hypothetical protein
MKKSNWHGGKGSGRRGSDDKKYADNWDAIFGKPRDNINTRGKGEQNGNTTSDSDNKK